MDILYRRIAQRIREDEDFRDYLIKLVGHAFALTEDELVAALKFGMDDGPDPWATVQVAAKLVTAIPPEALDAMPCVVSSREFEEDEE
jgi:hypothetical protein